MLKTYSRINWENEPSLATPLNEANLNRMDLAVDTIDDRVISLDATKLDLETGYTMVKNVSLNPDNGVITVEYLNGSTATYDTKLEKIAVNFRYDAATQSLIIELDDGTEQSVDLSAFITPTEFTDSDTIAWGVNGNTVAASVKEGSITESKLQPNFLADCRQQAEQAEDSANNARESREISEGWAVGTQYGTPVSQGSPYFHNNAKYWSDQAQAIAGGYTAGYGISIEGGVISVNLPNAEGSEF